jgi:hypothetical protein
MPITTSRSVSLVVLQKRKENVLPPLAVAPVWPHCHQTFSPLDMEGMHGEFPLLQNILSSKFFQ